MEEQVNEPASGKESKAGLFGDTTKALAYITTFGFLGVLLLMSFNAAPPENKDVLNLLLGSLGTAWAAIVSYYFGSSASSDRKTEIMSKPDKQKP